MTECIILYSSLPDVLMIIAAKRLVNLSHMQSITYEQKQLVDVMRECTSISIREGQLTLPVEFCGIERHCLTIVY